MGQVVQRHYDLVEKRVLVDPILALIQISPTAQKTFLGDWTPYESESVASDEPLDMVEHLVYRLVFDAIRDLANTRTVPPDGVVREARVSGVSNLAQRHEPPLLELVLRDDDILGFNAGFDTEHLFYQGEDDGPEDMAEATRNPEDCWVDVWWDHCPPSWSDPSFGAKIGYSFEDPMLLNRILEESAVPGTKKDRPITFKQAAWLGDNILDAWATSALLVRLNSERVKDLDLLRQRLTSNEALARIARQLGLRVTPRTQPSAGEAAMRDAEEGMLGDSVEALVGAAYMDGGLKAAHAVAKRLMMRPLEAVAPTGYP
ncbi:ribonuclease III, partial [mine drainage metagenome]